MEHLNAPLSTYRLQFNAQFTFRHACEWVEYLHRLGISHLYASPLLCTRAGCLHGYDIVDHSKLNPEIGTENDFEELIKTLRTFNMGMILDIVPNHMCIVSPANKWWNDILENGPASPFADYFDIDWHPPRQELANKVLLPFLDEQYGAALENQTFKAVFREGAFFMELHDTVLPTDPKSWNLILDPLAKEARSKLPEDSSDLLELNSIMTALTHLPATTETDKEKISERLQEIEVIKRRLAGLMTQNEALNVMLSQQLFYLNGTKGDPTSFNGLELFLNIQPYRLCFWRVANDEINYRCFFDIFELAGIQTQNHEVFEAAHAYIFKLVQNNLVDGLRIDHIDGLWNPEEYLQALQRHCNTGKDNPFYIIVEKILTGNEKLHSQWPVQGTVGYEFLDQVNRLFVLQPNRKKILSFYNSFTGVSTVIHKLVYECKQLILLVAMPGELHILAKQLDRISQQHRSSRDFTAESLKTALRDVIACFPVYRSYIHGNDVKIEEEDERYIRTAISQAKYLNPALSAYIFDFIESVLLLQHHSGLDDEQMKERKNFVMRFQQITGPVMAKGLEDTASYRYYPLASLNDVGSYPANFGISIDEFHKKNLERSKLWPHTVLTTSTHDTKRSEDVRSRINVLSEMPDDWEQAVMRWSLLNQPHKVQDGDDAIPDANEEYFIYQTLIGTWPLYPMDPAAHLQYMNRIQEYIEKAFKEAKIHTSWINPNIKYDQLIRQFIQKILNSNLVSNAFLTDFIHFIPKISAAGMLNSLSQLIIKLTSPGIPDIYQGNEVWNFKLVDPDNRQPIDYPGRNYLLKGILEQQSPIFPGQLQQMLQHPEDGRIKLFLTMQTLQMRYQNPDLFLYGNYHPLNVQGDKQNHIIAYARMFENKIAIIVTARFFFAFLNPEGIEINPDHWKNTFIELPPEWDHCSFYSSCTGINVMPEKSNNSILIPVDKIFYQLPFDLLIHS